MRKIDLDHFHRTHTTLRTMPAAPSQNDDIPTQKCGICDRQVWANPRYPWSVCYPCQFQSSPVDENGNPMDFFNIDHTGGFFSMTMVNGKQVRGENHTCFIKGNKCWADEARFGGIVISACPP